MDIQTKDGILLRGIPEGTPEEAIKARINEIRASRTTQPKRPADAPSKPNTPLQSAGRQLGLTARMGIEGIGGLANLVTGPIDAATSAVDKSGILPQRLPKFSGGAIQLADTLGLPTAESPGERFAADVGTPVASAMGVTGLARNLLQNATARATPYLEMLASRPGLQAISAGGAGTGQHVAKESGAGPSGQLAAALAAGAIAPAGSGIAQGAGRNIKDIASVFGAGFGHKGAIDRLAKDAVQRVAGDSYGRIKAALPNATTYVRGAKPTLAEAIAEAQTGKPEQFGGAMIKLQRDLTGADGIEDILPSAARAQKQALLSPIQRMAGGATKKAQDAAQATAKQTRESGAGAQYRKLASTWAHKDQNLDALLSSPSGSKALEFARKVAGDKAAALRARGEPVTPFELVDKDGKTLGYSAQGLQYVKETLDSFATNKSLQDQLGIAGTGKVQVGEVRKELINWMNNKIPGWEDARTAYAKQSGPLNRLTAAQAFEQKLKNDSGDLTSSSFLKAMGSGEEALLKKSGGGARAESVEEIFRPAEASKIRGVGKHLARQEEANRIVKDIKSSNAADLAGAELPKPPTLLNRKMMVMNFGLKLVARDANTPVAKRIAEAMTDPKEFARLMSKPPQDPMRKIAEELARKALIAGMAAQSSGGQLPEKD